MKDFGFYPPAFDRYLSFSGCYHGTEGPLAPAVSIKLQSAGYIPLVNLKDNARLAGFRSGGRLMAETCSCDVFCGPQGEVMTLGMFYSVADLFVRYTIVYSASLTPKRRLFYHQRWRNN